MSPSTAFQDSNLDDPYAVEDERAALESLTRQKHEEETAVAAEEEEEDEDDEEDDDNDDDDVDDDEEDEDDDVDTDEEGYERTPMQDPVSTGRLDTSNRVADTDADTQAAPDVSSDRVPSTDAEPEGSLDKVKTAPLGIQEIENLEDDAKGG